MFAYQFLRLAGRKIDWRCRRESFPCLILLDIVVLYGKTKDSSLVGTMRFHKFPYTMVKVNCHIGFTTFLISSLSRNIARGNLPYLPRLIAGIAFVAAICDIALFPSVSLGTNFAITALAFVVVFVSAVSGSSLMFLGNVVLVTFLVGAASGSSTGMSTGGNFVVLFAFLISVVTFTGVCSSVPEIATAYLAVSTVVVISSIVAAQSSANLLATLFVLTGTVVVLGYVQEFSLKLQAEVLSILNFVTVKPALVLVSVISAHAGTTGHGILL